MIQKLKYLILNFFLFIAFVVLIFIGCNDSGNNSHTQIQTDPGILRTDEFGNILGGDTTDWCIRDSGVIYPVYSFGPAYPNPVNNNSFYLNFTLSQTDTVKIYFLKNNSDTIIIRNEILKLGFYTTLINVSAYNFRNTYQRLYIKSKNSTLPSGCNNYGDIKFQ